MNPNTFNALLEIIVVCGLRVLSNLKPRPTTSSKMCKIYDSHKEYRSTRSIKRHDSAFKNIDFKSYCIAPINKTIDAIWKTHTIISCLFPFRKYFMSTAKHSYLQKSKAIRTLLTNNEM